MEKLTEEELKEIFPAPEDKQKEINLKPKEKRMLLVMLDALKGYAKNELRIAKRARNNWLVSYEGTVEEAENDLEIVKKWVEHFKDKLSD